MIDRYTRPEMGKLWDDETKYQTWLEVEVLACEAWAEMGKIPREAVAEIRQKARIDIARILEIEAKIHHDVVAFTTQLAETIGPASKYVHMGLVQPAGYREQPKIDRSDTPEVLRKSQEGKTP